MAPLRLKTAAEIEAIAASGAVTAAVLSSVAAAVQPGATTNELNELAEQLCREQGAVPTFIGYHGYRHAICACPNDVIAHGLPNGYRLAAGDLLGIDFAATLDGFVADAALTVPVGEIGSTAETLLTGALQALEAGIAACQPEGFLGDIGAAVEAVARSYSLAIVEEMAGHGVGFEMHEEPTVRNVGRRGQGLHLREGMVLAIEPMLNLGGSAAILADDGWTLLTADGSLSAVFEHTVAITADGPRVLT